jgi:hypothetical protein
MISFFERKFNICRSLLATAHAPTKIRLLNSSKIFWHFHLKSLHDHKITAKMVSFGNIWSVFHLTTHEKRKTDQNYKKKHTKHCITRHFSWNDFCIAKNITRSKQNIPHLLTSDIDVPHKTVLHSKKIK